MEEEEEEGSEGLGTIFLNADLIEFSLIRKVFVCGSQVNLVPTTPSSNCKQSYNGDEK